MPPSIMCVIPVIYVLVSEARNNTDCAISSGSAYLLLNSLPFKDLEDKVLQDQTRMSSLFKEIGASHYVPYHLMLKWGSIYHRYKKKILEDVDILSGFLTNNITQPISGRTFFDNGITAVPPLFINENPVTHTIGEDVGIHPYYDAIFHQVVNGYIGVKLKQTEYKKGGKISKIAIMQGTKHELEHSDTIKSFTKTDVSVKEIARKIAIDHLQENPNYYKILTKLKLAKGGEVVCRSCSNSWSKHHKDVNMNVFDCEKCGNNNHKFYKGGVSPDMSKSEIKAFATTRPF